MPINPMISSTTLTEVRSGIRKSTGVTYAISKMPKRPRNARPTGGAFASGDSLVTAHLTNRLQILFRPGADAIECFLDVLDRVRHAEAQVTFPEIAKCRARERRNVRVVKQRVGKFLRWPAGLRDVWENIERSLGQTAGETFDLVEAGDHHVAPFFEFGAHRVHRLLVSTQRLDAGDLREARGARVRVSHQTSDMRREIGAHHAVAHAPTGHGISLGETVEQNAALLHPIDRHDGMMLTLENQSAVDLVAQYHDVAIADGARDTVDVFFFQHTAGGILR